MAKVWPYPSQADKRNTGGLNSLGVTLVLVLLSLTLTGCQPAPIDPQASDASEKYSVDFGAHWLKSDTLLLADAPAQAVLLISDAATLDEGGHASSEYPLQPVEQPLWVMAEFPHLKDFYAYNVNLPRGAIHTLVTQQLAVQKRDHNNQVTGLSYVQTGNLLDELYTRGGNDADEVSNYGATVAGSDVQFTIWAPTATSVAVHVFDENKAALSSNAMLPMTKDERTGVWSVSASSVPQRSFYRYQMTVYHPQTQAIETLMVTDPYSLSLSTNSTYSQVVDLNHPDSQPQGWQQQQVPPIAYPEQHILYEVHVRDFSAHDTALTSPAYAGKYLAFTEPDSDGVAHLKDLQKAGLNTVHLLPVYDISTVDEEGDEVVRLSDTVAEACEKASLPVCERAGDDTITLHELLNSFDTLSGEAQALIEKVRPYDDYNWGYDPYHYTVPEGSYAINPEGVSRIREFRQMVMALHDMGLRVVMDVVYNHTFESGVSKRSVLDKVVPGYYHRRHPVSGRIEQSTCCENTATERVMMAKLMIDSLVIWASQYKIDGFRFDLMGHQPKSVMLAAREAVRAVDPDTYFYGEGWNFGEVANNARFIQATQLELAGSEIGTFTDRLRDAVRGGSSFVFGTELREGQGLGTGLLTFANELATDDTRKAQRKAYETNMDQARIGLAGNLADFTITNASGKTVSGREVDYRGAPSGYALDPADTINYVSKHDNQTLWDNNQYRIPFAATTEQRVRMQMLSLAYPMYAQGIPFFHMGSELLRSKSFLRDSYDYGDWFNKVDFSYQSNNYNIGLPPAAKDQDNWPIIKMLIEQNEGRDHVSESHIRFAKSVFMDMLSVRASSPLFMLPTADEIISRVRFHDAVLQDDESPSEGVIIMEISDEAPLADLDPSREGLLIIFNNRPQLAAITWHTEKALRLHPALQGGADQSTAEASFAAGKVSVPGFSVAVFEW